MTHTPGADTRGGGGTFAPPDRFREARSPPLRFRGKKCSQFDKSYVFFNFKLFDYFLFNGNIIINIYWKIESSEEKDEKNIFLAC